MKIVDTETLCGLAPATYKKHLRQSFEALSDVLGEQERFKFVDRPLTRDYWYRLAVDLIDKYDGSWIDVMYVSDNGVGYVITTQRHNPHEFHCLRDFCTFIQFVLEQELNVYGTGQKKL